MKSTQRFEEIDDQHIKVISETIYTKQEFAMIMNPLIIPVKTINNQRVIEHDG